MDNKQISKLQSINDFSGLLEYLRDELDWPIEDFEFEELTFEYTPEELGIDEHNAAKILEIKRLRPLDDNQPWGIFFVGLEPKKLPVVALRRLLSKISMKKRASSNNADQVAWHHDDILFISNFGEESERQLCFAHFAINEEKHDLPILNVLGWDNKDTKLHVDYVVEMLKEKLIWPDDVEDTESWRQQWREAFTLRHKQVVSDSKEMAIRLAELARKIRDSILSVLEVEAKEGPLRQIMETFREALVHDLDEAGFADMYAQTIAYGLMSARIANPNGSNTVEHLGDYMRTNPFLRELMETFLDVGGRKRGKQKGAGLDFDELGVSEVVDLLDNANMEAVVRDFGDRNRQEDPVMHFYESFLHEYNKQLKVQRGVFYTPQPIVSYIVRSVHEQLQTEFGLEDGLADTTTWGEMLKKHPDMKLPSLTDEPGEKHTISPDEPFVQILDPATGTATFLLEVIEVIHETMDSKWKGQGFSKKERDSLWNEYIPRNLLTRLHAYELMMAPYAIAHLKVGLKLSETGYRFGSEQRVRIYLTNALESPKKQIALPEFEALAHEIAAVHEIKTTRFFTVVLGNPPYAGHSWNLTPELRSVIDTYRFVGDKRIVERGALQLEKNLQDDYVKFFCLSEKEIKKSGVGVLGLVTSHGFLDNSFLRGMRYSLLHTFNNLSILDLHGNVLRGESSPDGTKDVNVFDIKQTGIAISILSKSGGSNVGGVKHSDLWGDRPEKYKFLLQETSCTEKTTFLTPRHPSWLLVPLDESLASEYESYPSLISIMPLRSLAVVTGRDAFVIDYDEDTLVERMKVFAETSGDEVALDNKFNLRSSTWWSSKAARDQMPPSNEIKNYIREIDYRPFDRRYCFYHSSVFESLRRPVMGNLDPPKENLLLIATRMVKGEDYAHTFISSRLTEAIGLSSKTSNSAYVFPLYVYSGGENSLLKSEKHGNFSQEIFHLVEKYSGESVSPEEVFFYIYAILSSPSYRNRYSQLLKRDFPRVPIAGNSDLFQSIAKFGSNLATIHLLDTSSLQSGQIQSFGNSYQVNKVGWTPDDGGTVWLDGKGTAKNFQPGTSGFHPLPEDVWNFRIGGYQVCEKWLKDRGPKKGKPGRTLTDDDIAHYLKILVALTETISIMAEIDEVIEVHGGWPGAFTSVDC